MDDSKFFSENRARKENAPDCASNTKNGNAGSGVQSDSVKSTAAASVTLRDEPNYYITQVVGG